MLSRQLSQASPWRRSSVCVFCALRSQTQLPQCRPFSATSAVLKRTTDKAPKTKTKAKAQKVKGSNKSGISDAAAAASPSQSPPLLAAENALLDDNPLDPHEGIDDAATHGGGLSIKDALLTGKKGSKTKRKQDEKDDEPREALDISILYPDDLEFGPVEVEKPPVPMLAYGLDRVLFNPGVYRLQDPRSRVYNFDPYLEKIMPANEFDFDALSEYKTSSKDEDLLALTKRTGTKFTGSTSSMSGMLQHFHYVLSNFRKLNHSMLSRQFPDPSARFSKITLGPNAIFLRHKDGTYAIDADKSYDRPNIMSWLGHSLEKLLTTERSEFERFRKSSPDKAPAEDKSSRCYHYSKQGNLMMRSQLDAVDPRLPGTGVFDLKTRAVVSIRMNHREYLEGSGYQLRHALGEWESFEREFYDMTRATLLKYSLQVRMGRMDGIFIAYHNIERIFGFQYLSLSDMDAVLHGQHDTVLGDQEFKLSIGLVDEILTKAITKFPDTSIRLHFEAREGKRPFMYIFAEAVTEEQADAIQSAGEAEQKEFARTVVGVGKDDPKTQAEWQDIQDDVDEQIGEDQGEGQQEQSTTDVEESSDDNTETTATNAKDTPERPAAPRGPLMGWTMTLRSLVNSGYVERPEKLNASDEWKIEYHIKELPEESRWRLYDALKTRRQQLIGQSDEESNKGLKHYRDLIQRFSDRGRKWRQEQDKLDDAKGVQMYRPLGPGSGTEGVDMFDEATERNDMTTAADESSSDEIPATDSLSQEKKEEVLDGVPASPS